MSTPPTPVTAGREQDAPEGGCTCVPGDACSNCPVEDALSTRYREAWDAWAAAVEAGQPGGRVKALWRDVNEALDRMAPGPAEPHAPAGREQDARETLRALSEAVPAPAAPGSDTEGTRR